MWIVVEFDLEEADPDQSVLGYYGPFPDDKAAQEWSDARWEEYDEEMQEFRALTVENIRPIEKWEDNHSWP
jgi:hypothetical protein